MRRGEPNWKNEFSGKTKLCKLFMWNGHPLRLHHWKFEWPRKVWVTLLFLLLPWPFFIYEFFTSEQWNDLKTTGSEIINEMSECKGLRSLALCYLRAILYFVIFLSTGASVNLGVHKGITRRFKDALAPRHITVVHCANHRMELVFHHSMEQFPDLMEIEKESNHIYR